MQLPGTTQMECPSGRHLPLTHPVKLHAGLPTSLASGGLVREPTSSLWKKLNTETPGAWSLPYRPAQASSRVWPVSCVVRYLRQMAVSMQQFAGDAQVLLLKRSMHLRIC